MHVRACSQMIKALKVTQSEDEDSAAIGLDGDRLCLRMKKFDGSIHDRPAVVNVRVFFWRDGRMRVSRG